MLEKIFGGKKKGGGNEQDGDLAVMERPSAPVVPLGLDSRVVQIHREIADVEAEKRVLETPGEAEARELATAARIRGQIDAAEHAHAAAIEKLLDVRAKRGDETALALELDRCARELTVARSLEPQAVAAENRAKEFAQARKVERTHRDRIIREIRGRLQEVKVALFREMRDGKRDEYNRLAAAMGQVLRDFAVLAQVAQSENIKDAELVNVMPALESRGSPQYALQIPTLFLDRNRGAPLMAVSIPLLRERFVPAQLAESERAVRAQLRRALGQSE